MPGSLKQLEPGNRLHDLSKDREVLSPHVCTSGHTGSLKRYPETNSRVNCEGRGEEGRGTARCDQIRFFTFLNCLKVLSIEN